MVEFRRRTPIQADETFRNTYAAPVALNRELSVDLMGSGFGMVRPVHRRVEDIRSPYLLDPDEATADRVYEQRFQFQGVVHSDIDLETGEERTRPARLDVSIDYESASNAAVALEVMDELWADRSGTIPPPFLMAYELAVQNREQSDEA